MAKRCICVDIHLLVRSLFPESQRLEGYITNKLPNISRCIADIYRGIRESVDSLCLDDMGTAYHVIHFKSFLTLKF